MWTEWRACQARNAFHESGNIFHYDQFQTVEASGVWIQSEDGLRAVEWVLDHIYRPGDVVHVIHVAKIKAPTTEIYHGKLLLWPESWRCTVICAYVPCDVWVMSFILSRKSLNFLTCVHIP